MVGTHSYWSPIVPTATGKGTGPGNAVDEVAVGDRYDHPQEPICEADPTYRVSRSPPGDQGSYDGKGQEEHESHRFADDADDGRVVRESCGPGEEVQHDDGDEHGHTKPANDHASKEVARVPIPPLIRSRPFVPSVTTPLYSTAVSRALRQTLRRSRFEPAWVERFEDHLT
jgi:hypothetical protein